jgi:protoporphyrinogen oxidase
VSDFRYPTNGGFVSFLRPLIQGLDLKLNHKVVKLEPWARTLTFGNGETVGYDHVVSSLPLPELVRKIPGAPPDVVAAAERLACTTCVLVNIGLDRADISDWHWTYFYDDEYCFTRVSFPHLLSPNNVPPGCGSIQAEIYYSAKYRPLDRSPMELVPSAIEDLRKCGLIRDGDRILHQNAMVTEYANVIFDLDRKAAVQTVHGFLDDIGIYYCGRYGEWGYQWTDEAFKSGESAAQQVLDARVVAGK